MEHPKQQRKKIQTASLATIGNLIEVIPSDEIQHQVDVDLLMATRKFNGMEGFRLLKKHPETSNE